MNLIKHFLFAALFAALTTCGVTPAFAADVTCPKRANGAFVIDVLTPVIEGSCVSTPSALAPDLWLSWYDSPLSQDSAATTPATAATDPVGHWYDLSGNGRHFSQPTSARRPTLTVVDGKLVPVFDGIDDLLDLAYESIFTTAPFTWVFTFDSNSLSSTRGDTANLLTYVAGQNVGIRIISTNDKIRFEVRNPSNTLFIITSNSAIVVDTRYVVIVTLDASYNMKMRVNGTLQTDTGNSGSIKTSGTSVIRIGAFGIASQRLSGSISTALFISRVITAEEITILTQDLSR